MQQPPGFETDNPHLVCKLNKAYLRIKTSTKSLVSKAQQHTAQSRFQLHQSLSLLSF